MRKGRGSFSTERIEKPIENLSRNWEASRLYDAYNSSPHGKPYGLKTISEYRNPGSILDKDNNWLLF